jgi:drug/metabolite transporter (DMT)-like permease
VPADALGLALAAAVLHALWNVLLARADDPEAATATAVVLGTVALAPVALLTWRMEAAAIPYLAASVALELAYLAALARGYRTGRLAVVYPVARGSAPVLVLLVSGAALGVHVGPSQAVAVGLIVTGVLLLRGVGQTGDGLLAGLAVGACIAGYTLVDAHGLDHAAPLPYLLVVLGLPGVLYAAAIARRRPAGTLRAQLSGRTATAGLATVGAYGLVLVALTRAAAGPVAAVRESSVVLALAFAAHAERRGLRRRELGGGIAVALGVALLAIA